ncbi:MAG: electron transfer flavoprotein subunit beta/FixA family protein [Desulfomonile tiedjei]|uniref:Electron transfer flavoprotein subunit beta/FixA family protein n=1 Tax=Desulfomonile tiedjei TaxID=2358 RepID=A0A9D6V662_9BACT|nr:electron transfer flavoprotein subunit beta/FixA family protein [Desulfomonile tiedjei]
MRILVCVKQLLEPETPLCIDESGRWVNISQTTPRQMNRFDEYALEQALVIREQTPDTTVDAISAGPESCSTVVRRALGMGADHGIHLLTGDQGYVSPIRTASCIALAARSRKYDLILAGVMSEDMAQGLVGPMVAEMLSLPCATSCIFVRVELAKASVYVEREIEGGRRQALELDLPALVSIQSGINKPRYPSLSNIMRANRQKLEVISTVAAEPSRSCEDLLHLSYPRKTRAGVLLEGTRKDKARQLLRVFRERSLLH